MRWRNTKRDDAQTSEDGPTTDPSSVDEAGVAAADAPDDAPGTPRGAAQRPDVPVMLGAVDPVQLERAVRRVVAKALAEDLGSRGDITSATTVPVDTRGRAHLVARADGVVAGMAVVTEVARQVDPRIEVSTRVEDGDGVARGDVLAEVSGPLRSVLTAERTMLNILCQVSGVATHTRAFADVLDGTDCVVRDTRKTTPGLRLLEKHAVACGGGANHRIGLFDAILVKDNHVAAAGGIDAAARAALAGAPEGVHVQVEVTSIDEALVAIEAGVTDLLLDNFTPQGIREALDVIAGRAAVEASGGITLETARAYAEAGADRLAVGALTHSAPALDLALDVVEVIPGAAAALSARRVAESEAVALAAVADVADVDIEVEVDQDDDETVEVDVEVVASAEAGSSADEDASEDEFDASDEDASEDEFDASDEDESVEIEVEDDGSLDDASEDDDGDVSAEADADDGSGDEDSSPATEG